MTSQIVSDSIDETFPIPGQDNDSQGFRENFTIIKDGLATAASEITVLQETTAKLDQANDFSGTLIDNATTNRLSELMFFHGVQTGTVIVDYEGGTYHRINVNGPCNLNFANWPERDDAVSKIILEINAFVDLDTPTTISFSSPGSDVIKYSWLLASDTTIRTISPGTVTKIFEAWTPDNGLTVFVNYKGEYGEI
jgi:hypothetical protein